MAEPSIDIKRTLAEFLGQHATMSLATVDDTDRPHAANLYFAPDDDLNLYFVSDKASEHSQHIAKRPQIAATVYAPVKMWQQIRGVQLHGTCTPIDPGEFAIVWGIYMKKFPHITDVQDLIRSQQFYRIRPTWFRWIDNAVRFGYRVETKWPAPEG